MTSINKERYIEFISMNIAIGALHKSLIRVNLYENPSLRS